MLPPPSRPFVPPMRSPSPEWRRRLVAYAGDAVAIEYHEPCGARLVEFLFGRTPAYAAGSPALTFRLRFLGAGRGLGLYREDRLIYRGVAEGYLAELLMGEVCRHLAEHSQGGAVFHAAALSRGGRAVLLVGATGAGKSTLAAWLALRGFAYLTDELIFLPSGSLHIQPFIRPINLKAPSLEVLPQLKGEAFQPHTLPSAGGLLIAPEALNPQGLWEAPPIGAILFPCYTPQGPAQFERLSSAASALHLLQSLVNGPSLPSRGLAEAARLAQAAPAYRLRYAHFGEVEASFSQCPDLR